MPAPAVQLARLCSAGLTGRGCVEPGAVRSTAAVLLLCRCRSGFGYIVGVGAELGAGSVVLVLFWCSDPMSRWHPRFELRSGRRRGTSPLPRRPATWRSTRSTPALRGDSLIVEASIARGPALLETAIDNSLTDSCGAVHDHRVFEVSCVVEKSSETGAESRVPRPNPWRAWGLAETEIASEPRLDDRRDPGSIE